MKVAVSSTGKDLNSQLDPRFGRCEYFIIVETDDMSFEAFVNESVSLGGGAGIQSAVFVSSKGAGAVLTGNCGPKAMQALSAGGLKVFTGQAGTVGEAVENFKKGSMKSTTEATVSEKSGIGVTEAMGGAQPQGGGRGMGGGGGMGMGGGGRCMGGGRGMGMGGGRGMGGGGGMGMGGGRGMGGGGGMGMGRGVGMPGPDQETSGGLSQKEELRLLKEQAEELKKQTETIESRIKSLK
ncbi:MAG: NifB/NifX family molybdenum-iron cluster-binding protein [Thermodesulfobacteriota bacterium]|nr:NifB/NifX family molybdenum-iron cluster-binding protein [Thermodesulfobacteriota bacterium]